MRKSLSILFAGKNLLSGLLILTPFLFSNVFNEAFEFPKMYFVYFLGSLLFLMTFLRQLWSAKEENKIINGFTYLAGLFFFSFIFSTLFSTHLYTSMWGYFSRFNGGFVSVLVFFGIYLSILRIKPPTQDVLKIVALTLLPTSLYSIMQHAGLNGNWTTDTTVRTFSTFGQPNWYAAYCAVVLPIALYLGLKDPSSKSVTDLSSWRWLILYVFGFTGFWFTYSVSGILGLLTSTISVLILNKRLALKKWRQFTLLFTMCLAVAFLNQGIFKQRISDALKDISHNHKEVPAQTIPLTNSTDNLLEQPSESPQGSKSETHQISPNKRTNNGDYDLSDSGFIRKGIWEGTLKLWLSTPKNMLIGIGPESFPYEFQFFRPSSLNYSSEWNYILNKPHNYYLEILSQNGLIGLLIYLAIVIKVLQARHPVLTSAMVGLFVTNIFGWPTVYTTLLFWTFLGLLALESTQPNPIHKRIPASHKIILSSLVVALYSYANFLFGRQVLADFFSKTSDSCLRVGESKKALDYINKSIVLNPNEPYYYRQRAKTHIVNLVNKPEREITQIKGLAYKDMLTSKNLNPKNLATLRGNIPLYYLLSIKDLTDVASADEDTVLDPNNQDLRYLTLASSYYSNMSQKYPNDVGVQAQIAKYQRMLGLGNDYKTTLENIKKLRPDLLEWYLNAD